MQLEIYAYLYNEIVTMKYRITNSNRHAADMLEDLLMNPERRAAYTDNVIHKRGLIKKKQLASISDRKYLLRTITQSVRDYSYNILYNFLFLGSTYYVCHIAVLD